MFAAASCSIDNTDVVVQVRRWSMGRAKVAISSVDTLVLNVYYMEDS